VAGVEIL